MTNAEKYKTAKERAEAFGNYCDSQQHGCNECALTKYGGDMCRYAWLELEVPHEKAFACPFCGCEPLIDEIDGMYRIGCNNMNCGMAAYTAYRKPKDEAIAIWNRRAK